MVIAMMAMSAIPGIATAGTMSQGPSGGHNGDRPPTPGSFQLNQSVVYGEVVDGAQGIYMDGTLFDLGSYTNDWGVTSTMYGTEMPVWQADVDWSDNLVLHQFRAGDKIRTEVILQSIDYPGAAIFTVRAGFSITNMSSGLALWSHTTYEGLWVDGSTDAYSAEVNQAGMLLYGYNWDSTEIGESAPGLYKLEFRIEPTYGTTPYGDAVSSSDIQLNNLVDLGYEGDDNFALKGYGMSTYSSYIIIELLP